MWFKSNFTVPAVAAISFCLIGGTVPAPAYADLGDQLFKLLPEDGVLNDHFGAAVAISGTIAIVGAYRDDFAGGLDSGSAYLFDITNGQQMFKLVANDPGAGDEFGVRVAISGSTAIVGAWHHDDNGEKSGAAYLFDTTTGRQLFKLLAKDGAPGDNFGVRVAISGTTVIVGAIGHDDNGSNSGSAYLFDTTTGRQLLKLLPNDGEAYSWFGLSVAISGNIAIVGSGNRYGPNSAYLFDTTTGLQLFKLFDNTDGWFGVSVAISGSIAIVGAEFEDTKNGNTSGSAYLFDISDPKNPVQIAKLLADDRAGGSHFGTSVAISGATVIVGADGLDDNGTATGVAYLFDTTSGRQIAKLLPKDGAANDTFGAAVAISGATAIVGSSLDDDNGTKSGSAYLFDASFCPWDLDGSDSVGASDLLALLVTWGPCADCKDCPADFDDNCTVGATDLLALLVNWGPCP